MNTPEHLLKLRDKKRNKIVEKIVVKKMDDDDANLDWLEQSNNREDKKRLMSYGETWWMIGIKAEAKILTRESDTSWLTNYISSGGLWNIESDTSEEELIEIGQEQLNDLAIVLDILGFNKKEVLEEISKAVIIKE